MKKKDLKDLIRHMALHSNYRDNGYIQMTTEEKALYDRVLRRKRPEFYEEYDEATRARYDKVRGDGALQAERSGYSRHRPGS